MVNIVNLEFRCQRTFSKVTVPDYDKNIKKVIRALELRLRKIITSWSFILQSVTIQLIWFTRPLISKWSHLILCPVVLTLSAVWHGVIFSEGFEVDFQKSPSLLACQVYIKMRKFTIFANDSEYWDAQRKVSPIFFLREAGWGASVHRQKSNHYRIDHSASGSYSNTVLRRLNSWAIVTKTSLLFLFLYIPSAVSLIFPRGIGADSQEREIKVIQSAKISQKPNLCNENKITVWKRHVIR